MLIESGVDVDASDSEVFVATFAVAMCCVEELMHYSLLVAVRCAQAASPLHWGVWNGHADVVHLLLECGANADAADKEVRVEVLPELCFAAMAVGV